jgi:hypothetical protein
VSDISDLIAIAFVRRTLMELGFQLNPDAMGRQADVGALELWVHEPRPELGGATPLAVLKTESGEDRIREVLRGLSESGSGLGS